MEAKDAIKLSVEQVTGELSKIYDIIEDAIINKKQYDIEISTISKPVKYILEQEGYIITQCNKVQNNIYETVYIITWFK